jgi:hypothetical protein
MTVRALCGGELSGERLVRLVYMDEAGIGKLADEPALVVGAVILNADRQLAQVERALISLTSGQELHLGASRGASNPKAKAKKRKGGKRK